MIKSVNKIILDFIKEYSHSFVTFEFGAASLVAVNQLLFGALPQCCMTFELLSE